MKALVVVESPAKANTIKKYLGRNFQIKASIGHVKDLPKKSLGVDPAKDFKPEYEVIKGKEKVLKEIAKAAASVDKVYLAPDPDREGEAIAWHIYEDIKKKNKNVFRVLINEITKKAVEEAISHPGPLNKDKFEAQQTRRILDRLVGYKISPILWRKVRRGLSAGRVQSVALRMVVDREAEIQAFKPEEYWSIVAKLSSDGKEFEARLFQIEGRKAEIANEKEAKAILTALHGARFSIAAVVRKERKKNPVPPFITSKLQQDAARKLGFSADRTMRLAQKLYEGIEVGAEGALGLITYMRTDSTRLSGESISAVRSYIVKTYGKEYLPDAPNIYKSRKSAQEAHEAIRPTSLAHPPERIKSYLDRDLYRLYELIWNRFVACQMMPALIDQTILTIDAIGPHALRGKYIFRATGQVVKFLGFLAVYQEEKEEIQKKKDENNEEEEGTSQLPDVKENDRADLKELTPLQHFTEPPPRFSEASLIKALEENGIGRPSTYASILNAIQEREYAEKKENRFYPTELGNLVTDLLVKSFPEILNIEFTAGMEEKLDLIEEGKVDWIKMLKEFYQPFNQALKKAEKEMRNVKVEEKVTGHLCDKCGSPMVIKWGRRGQFLACSSYPECKNTRDFAINHEGELEIQAKEKTGQTCDLCHSSLIVKRGRFGRFLACSRYPECKFTKSFTLGVPCPQKGCGGEIVERSSRAGRIFYGCKNYPKCKFASWYPLINKPCPSCGAAFLVSKTTKSEGTTHFCLNKECNYKESV